MRLDGSSALLPTPANFCRGSGSRRHPAVLFRGAGLLRKHLRDLALNLNGLGIERHHLLRLHLVRHAARLNFGDLVHDELELLLQLLDLASELVLVVGFLGGLCASPL